MIRKILVAVISLIYMALGLWNFYNSLFPVLSSSGLFVIRLFPLVGGALAFYAGLTMFRLNEFGRKLVVVLLSIRVVINALSILWLPKNGRRLFITGHSEYDPLTLKGEYDRDVNKGLPIHVPKNYYPKDDPTQTPTVRWRGHANLLYSNWLNYYVYQVTPYDVSQIP